MKTRIVVGCGLLLTLGTAMGAMGGMGGTWMYGHGKLAKEEIVVAAAPTKQVTPEMIAMWRATAVSTNYLAPRVPL